MKPKPHAEGATMMTPEQHEQLQELFGRGLQQSAVVRSQISQLPW